MYFIPNYIFGLNDILFSSNTEVITFFALFNNY